MLKRMISFVAVAGLVLALAGPAMGAWVDHGDSVISINTTLVDPVDTNSITVDSGATLDVTKSTLIIEGKESVSTKGYGIWLSGGSTFNMHGNVTLADTSARFLLDASTAALDLLKI